MLQRPAMQRVFSFPVVLAAALLATLSLLAANAQQVLSDPDIWWHLNNARFLITTHHFIRQDYFSFTVAGMPWLNIEWLAELPYYFAYRWFGDRGLFLAMTGTVQAIALGVFILSYLRSGDYKAAFLAAWIAGLFATVSLGPRMLLFGWLLLVAELIILWLYRAGRDCTWAIPLLFVVWINTHGSWLIGFILLLLWIGSGFVHGTWGSIEATSWTPAQRNRLLFMASISFAALFVNPYGWRLVAYPFDLAFNQAANIQYIAEWATIDFHSPRGKVVLAFLLGFALLNLVKRRQWPLHELLFALIAVYSAFTYSRFIFMAGILLAPLFAIDFRGLLGDYDAAQDRVGRNMAALAMVAAVIYLAMPSQAKLHEGAVTGFPEKALAHVAQLPADARIFNHYEWGGYLMWNATQRPVFIDSRTDVFVHAGVFQDYTLASAPFRSLDIFDKYRIQYVLVPRDTSLGYLLDQTQAWTRDYQDDTSVLYRRSVAPLRDDAHRGRL